MSGDGAAGVVRSDASNVFAETLDLDCPNIESGQGVWLYTTAGERILDASSGGAMVSCLGSGAQAVIDAAAEQSETIAYYYNYQFTNEPQERFAERLIAVAAPEMARVRFVSSGSEANETALRLARAYHVERGQADRWRVISVSQSYHGATMATLALTGRSAVRGPFSPYLAPHLHIAPSTRRTDPTGERALEELDRRLAEAGPETVSAFICEPVSALSLPAYSPPDRFWEGLAERREKHGFLIIFDEVVTGMGRTGSWFAYQQLPIVPDIVTAGKGLGAGYAPVAAALCREDVYAPIAQGSQAFDLGHTWDGAPLPCAVGLAVLETLREQGLVERVRDRGPRLLEDLRSALGRSAIVGEVRGRGFLLGVELVDPRDGLSFLPPELDAAHLVEAMALRHGLLVRGTQSTADGFAGDEILLAPAFTSSDEELSAMVERFAATIAGVEPSVTESLAAARAGV